MNNKQLTDLLDAALWTIVYTLVDGTHERLENRRRFGSTFERNDRHDIVRAKTDLQILFSHARHCDASAELTRKCRRIAHIRRQLIRQRPKTNQFPAAQQYAQA